MAGASARRERRYAINHARAGSSRWAPSINARCGAPRRLCLTDILIMDEPTSAIAEKAVAHPFAQM